MKIRSKVNQVNLIAVGDLMPNRDEPETIVELVAPSLKKYDIRFGQMEICLSKRGTPNPVVGMVHAKAHPHNVKALIAASFDVVSCAGNHCLDWGAEALFDTINTIRNEGIQTVGAGNDIVEARKPVILERNGIRVGFLAYNSVLSPGYWAGVNQPGCAPLRIRTFYEMMYPDQPGCPPRIWTYPYQEDLDAMLEDIKRVKADANVLVLSLHWGLRFTRAKLATYQRSVAHAAIDAGADIIIGTHPHILKGCEVYKGKAIFYSLCNFAFDSNLRNWPDLTPRQLEMFEVYGWKVDPDWAHTYPHPSDSRKTLAVKCLISDSGIEKVSYLPVMINVKAQPSFLTSTDPGFGEVVEYMEQITAEAKLNGSYKVEDDEVVVS